MARLNEPPVSSDTIETLRKKMLRQNRELAKCNNVRALRIRELESELACAISENLELRGRILGLEKEAEDNEARRIADYAMAIKEKLESQLTEWGTLLAGLGHEPPMKRHSPRVRKPMRPRPSFSASRPSPSQRRLREVAGVVEGLGHIAEHKSYSRQSMNPEQIQALKSEYDSTLSSASIKPEQNRLKIERPRSKQSQRPSIPSISIASITFPDEAADDNEVSAAVLPSKDTSPTPQETEPLPAPNNIVETTTIRTIKTGSKRKLDSRDDMEEILVLRNALDNQEQGSLGGRVSIRDKAYGKTLKELAIMRKDARAKLEPPKSPRKPLSLKNANEDVSSPKKNAKPAMPTDTFPIKADFSKSKLAHENSKLKPKVAKTIKIESDATLAEVQPCASVIAAELGKATHEPRLLSPHSPELLTSLDDTRGDTPPPADITSRGEMSRPSRRSRAAVSYAEPNLRDKMRRPTKELFDAVAGEGKSRRWSQEPSAIEGLHVKRESLGTADLGHIPMAKIIHDEPASPDTTESPLMRKRTSTEEPSASDGTQRTRRTASSFRKMATSSEDVLRQDSANVDAGDSSLTDVYEFESSSPKMDDVNASRSKPTRGRAVSSRRFSTTVDKEHSAEVKERTSLRRNSMMI